VVDMALFPIAGKQWLIHGCRDSHSSHGDIIINHQNSATLRVEWCKTQSWFWNIWVPLYSSAHP